MSDPPEKPQADKFRDLARELECDEDEARFEETVKRIVKAPPKAEDAEGSPTDPEAA
jgi:hypothetical protein